MLQEEIRVAIVEDEEIWSKSIAATLVDFGYSVAGIAENFEDAVTLLNAGQYDIVLMDINLQNRNKGIELGSMANALYDKPFIFMTSSTDARVVSEAVKARPAAYLTKPVHPSSLIATIQSAIHNHSNRLAPAEGHTASGNTFFIKQGNRYKQINWNDVVMLRAGKNYTMLLNAADNTEYFVRSTLSKTMNFIIPESMRTRFVQVNRAEAVQLGYIKELVEEEIRTAFGTLTLTESFAPGLKNAIRIVS